MVEQPEHPEHVDVLVVGAGMSGIGAACHLQRESPGRTYAILEARGETGGTWDLFRYPGVRSDSDMFTLGYSFRPWRAPEAVADGATILSYVRDTAAAHGVTDRVRFHHQVLRADWSSADARWTVEARRADTGRTVRLTCSFLWSCTGYYRYDEGWSPRFEGTERFAGRIVHPQHWPADLAYAGKRVVVIGSGATAVTLVPSLAREAAHVTMLQRSPSHVVSLPSTDPVADVLRRVLPARAAYRLIRWKNVLLMTAAYQLSRRRPALVRRLLRRAQVAALPPGFDVDTHFNPAYDPWDQRLCVVPDGDLFGAIRAGRASVVTDRVSTFTETGIRLASGAELPADVVVTATGLTLLALGGLTLRVDGVPVALPDTLAYKGMMLSGVPNFALTVGYTNASWTLKADLVAEHVVRLLRHLDAHGFAAVTPVAPAGLDPGALAPLIDLTSGYVARGAGLLPRQGPAAPWRVHQNYLRDVRLYRHGPVADAALRFDRAPVPAGRRDTLDGARAREA